MKKVKIYIPLLFLLLVACGGKSGIIGPVAGSIYFNSFESAQDTIGWKGSGSIDFSEDAPPGGGKRSLFVSGACSVPHAVFTLPALAEDGYYRLQCWGKNLQLGGSVRLAVEGLETGQQVVVQDSNWVFLETNQPLFCPKHYHLCLMLSSGGIVASAMLVDLIQIIKVSN